MAKIPPIYKKLPKLDLICKNGQNLTPYTKNDQNCPLPPYKKWQNLTPLKNDKIWPLINFLPPFTTKWHSRDPLYKKAFTRLPYTTKWNFQEPPIQKNWHFWAHLYNKMAFSRPLISKNYIFETNLYKTWHFREPHTKYWHFRDPLYKKTDVHPPPYFKWLIV